MNNPSTQDKAVLSIESLEVKLLIYVAEASGSCVFFQEIASRKYVAYFLKATRYTSRVQHPSLYNPQCKCPKSASVLFISTYFSIVDCDSIPC